MVKFNLNGNQVSIDTGGDIPLLFILREDFLQNGPKFGCGIGQCGTCSVLVDGKVVRSCVIPVSAIEGRTVTTLEGLSLSSASGLHPIQHAFLEEQAAQCGYCTNGMIMQAVSVLNENPKANDHEIRQAMSPVLCRCGAHARILKAIKRAQHENQGDE